MIAVFELFKRLCQGSVAEWSKALVLGTSHFGGVGSNPITIIAFCKPEGGILGFEIIYFV